MAFQQIDDTATADDKPLDTGLCRDVLGNASQARTDRIKGCTAGYHFVYPAKISALFPMCIPYIWPLTPGVTQITLTLRHKTPSNVTAGEIEMVVGASAHRMATYDDSPGQPTVSANLTISASMMTTTLALDVSDLSTGNATDILILLRFASSQGRERDLYTTGGDDAQETFLGVGNSFAAMSSNNTFAAASIPTKAIQLTDDGGLVWIPASQILMVVPRSAGSSDFKAIVWPAFGTYDDHGLNYTADQLWGSADYHPADASGELKWQYFDLGYIELFSVEIRETAITTMATSNERFNAKRRPSSLVGATLYSDAESVIFEQARVQSIGPSSETAKLGPVHFTTEPIDRIGNHVHNYDSTGTPYIDEDFQAIAGCVIGDEHTYVDTSGTTKTRTLITAAGLLQMHHYEDNSGGRGQLHYKVDTQLYLSDMDGTTDTVASQTHYYQGYSQCVYGMYSGLSRAASSAHLTHDFAYLTGLFTTKTHLSIADPVPPDTFKHSSHIGICPHALRGLWPISAWQTQPGQVPGFVPFRITVLDTHRTPLARLVRLRIKLPNRGLDDNVPRARRYITLATWSVWTEQILAPDFATYGVE